MKAIVFEEHGGLEKLQYRDWPDPEPDEGECIVRVRAVALNGFDPMILRSIPGLNIPLPMIPGGDVAGEIEAIGAGVDANQWPLGMRVMADPLLLDKGGVLGETVRGGACERIALPTTHLVPMPENVSFEDAAALPIAYGTAHRMMMTRGRVRAGERVVILGATGGVGTCCIQLAKLAGAEVAALTRSPEKSARLTALGADHVFVTSEQDYVSEIRERWGRPRVFEGGGGADVVVNYDGGDSWTECFKVLKRDGRLLTCGATNGYDPKTDIRYIWSFEFNILGCNGWTRDDLTSVLDLVSTGRLKPIKHSVRPLSELATSLNELMERAVVGKAILIP
ncbi:MAG: zinc-binding dehydrogenase [Pseudomonadota bacterium]